MTALVLATWMVWLIGAWAEGLYFMIVGLSTRHVPLYYVFTWVERLLPGGWARRQRFVYLHRFCEHAKIRCECNACAFAEVERGRVGADDGKRYE